MVISFLTFQTRILIEEYQILTRKPRHASSFSLECTDFKNVNFEKFPEPLLRSPGLPRSNDLEIQNDENSRLKLVKTR
jgi:hypothetical protein